MAGRTPDEIRASIEQNRQELGTSLVLLRDEVTQLTDWRGQVQAQREEPADRRRGGRLRASPAASAARSTCSSGAQQEAPLVDRQRV